ncbi:MAG: polysaccharide biosynthesis protein, partial [Bdellovibrionales bacterium]|nr:polysaccharide biosynthesis protein [Bdellovibrionales bacterium]
IGDDIDIKYTGLRPGEKLYEELLVTSENTLPTAHQMVRVARARSVQSQVMSEVDSLIKSAGDADQIRASLVRLVPEYLPNPTVGAKSLEVDPVVQ